MNIVEFSICFVFLILPMKNAAVVELAAVLDAAEAMVVLFIHPNDGYVER